MAVAVGGNIRRDAYVEIRLILYHGIGVFRDAPVQAGLAGAVVGLYGVEAAYGYAAAAAHAVVVVYHGLAAFVVYAVVGAYRRALAATAAAVAIHYRLAVVVHLHLARS